MVKSNIDPDPEQPEIPQKVVDKASCAVAMFATLQQFSIEDASDILINLIANFLMSGCKKGEEMKALGILADCIKSRWEVMQKLKKDIEKGGS